jgi:integral membrane protein
MKNPVSFLRTVGLIEAVSYLVLLFIAMPLKYGLGMDLAVKVFGSLHGALFVVFGLALLRVLIQCAWPITRAAWVFAASLIPFGTLLIDGQMKRWAAQAGS